MPSSPQLPAGLGVFVFMFIYIMVTMVIIIISNYYDRQSVTELLLLSGTVLNTLQTLSHATLTTTL